MCAAITRIADLSQMDKPKTCRQLFGPVNHDQMRKDLEEMHQQLDEQAIARWNFDFKRETPIGGGRFHWTAVVPHRDASSGVSMSMKVTCTPLSDGGELRALDYVSASGQNLAAAAVAGKSEDFGTAVQCKTPTPAELQPETEANKRKLDEQEEEDEKELEQIQHFTQKAITDYFPRKKNTHSSAPVKRRKIDL